MAELTITNANFQKEVLESDKPVLVDFWARNRPTEEFCDFDSYVIDLIRADQSFDTTMTFLLDL